MIRKKGKHSRRIHPRFSKILCFFMLFTIAGRTTAYLMSEDSVQNGFEVGIVRPEIIETFDSSTKIKEDVSVKNSGNVPIYVRTAVIIKWKDNDGRILDIVPKRNVDYTISFLTSPNWIQSQDGYYYYKRILDPNASTDILIEECVQIRNNIDRTLEVSIISQGIQADPRTAVEEAWNVNVVNDLISLGG